MKLQADGSQQRELFCGTVLTSLELNCLCKQSCQVVAVIEGLCCPNVGVSRLALDHTLILTPIILQFLQPKSGFICLRFHGNICVLRNRSDKQADALRLIISSGNHGLILVATLLSSSWMKTFFTCCSNCGLIWISSSDRGGEAEAHCWEASDFQFVVC